MGYQIIKNIAIETSYFSKGDSQKNLDNIAVTFGGHEYNAKSKSISKLRIISLDSIFSYDIYDMVKILGIVGLSSVSYSSKLQTNIQDVLANAKVSENGYSINFGLGSELDVTKNLSIRMLVKASKTISMKAFNYIETYNVGIRYKF